MADACNHRIQVFDANVQPPELLFHWGNPGSGAGQLNYPYASELLDDGNVMVCEFGNHRVQKFTTDGKSLGVWGTAGKQPGQFSQPWAMAIDSKNMIHVADTYNHRIQRFMFSSQPLPTTNINRDQ